MKAKFIIPFFLTPLLLTSCNKSSYVGYYAFQMGKNEGTHFGLSINLTKQDHFVDGINEGKYFKAVANSNVLVSESNPTGELIIEGGYTIGEKIDKDKKLVNMHYDMLESLKDLIAIIIGADPSSFETSTYVQKLVTTDISNRAFNFIVPVSLNDLYLQLYWYGFDINNKDSTVHQVEEHPLGSHPSEEEVKAIKATYDNNHLDEDGEDLQFRDFHTITIGLIKDGA